MNPPNPQIAVPTLPVGIKSNLDPEKPVKNKTKAVAKMPNSAKITIKPAE